MSLRLKRNTRNAELFLVISEIMHQSMFMLNMFVTLMQNTGGIHRRESEKIIRYVMATRIPKQIEHLQCLIDLNDVDCLDNLRMPRGPFARLCYLLEHVGGLVNSRYVTVKEKVALFLSILAHHKKIRIVRFDFKRSGYTVSKHFHAVLNAVLRLHTLLLVTPKPIGDDCTNPRWKWFKGCIGALDGTYIKVTVNESDKPRYRTRKGEIAVNVLVACDIDQKFTYILCGWEGSAADSRVLRDALNRPHGLKVPHGNYYLCDNGYANGDGFLTPFKGVRYHLKDWGEGSLTPQNPNEYFNMYHSKARNVIERTIGLLKKRWAILRSQSFYSITTQNRIIMACALLHNFIRSEMLVDPLEHCLNDTDSEDEEENDIDLIDTVEPSHAWNNFRNNLASSMFNEWRGVR